MTDNLRIAVIGAGRMGADHIKRLTHRIAGADVTGVVDVDGGRATSAAALAGEHTTTWDDPHAALASGEYDAVVLTTPGMLHYDVLMDALDRRLPVFCEKPLTADAATAREIVDAEAKIGERLIQVGFMRRYDAGYQRLRRFFTDESLGAPLMLHCRHRNPEPPPRFTDALMIYDSVVHEMDGVRYFTGEEITDISVRKGRATTGGDGRLSDPQQILMRTESGVLVDVEIFVNAMFGYQVHTEAVFEQGTVDIGNDEGAYVRSAGRWGGEVAPGFEQRFTAAFDTEFQGWVNRLLASAALDGPSAWDGYAAAVCCEAGVKAQTKESTVSVELGDKPALYAHSDATR
ncbi:Gfo/Idh/MocA family oxidoreductase [Salinisphaera sp. USBA-960]|uniref:Gfo/Idh/MocA family protein n=1 Tax=Salinisphaera orenii TaxID=856731 RepID=UPI000DBE71EC|nr:Gfo/Idh/MocA family oxidoreductase [Salifodinibacter halophilus]NNC25662.1 Gfo/Idh/MocA family oxidoreductase [Salifodinibacter halophilus]